MGEHMARRLLEHGYNVVVYDVREEAREPFRRFPQAVVARSVAEVGDQADTVLVSLPSPAAARAVAVGEGGLYTAKRMRTYVDLSTTGPLVSEEIGEALSGRGITVLDAPVSGGVPGARDGKLSVMVSGSRQEYEALLPVLQVIGNKVFYVGPKVGQAQVLKLANNYLSAVALVATSEAMVLGVKAGLSPQTMLEILNVSSGRNSATLDKFPAAVLDRTFDYGFKTGLMYKDLSLCLAEADRLGVSMWLGSNVREIFKLAQEKLGFASDTTEIVRLFEEWASAEVKRQP
ncbi:MAG: NAD(P)-dependent oxidoreductase [Alicyclobacillaceae bacterium]|nr:NAD(P)-dependent oxidoreductase [Alicyclobacillaceae bacterium]